MKNEYLYDRAFLRELDRYNNKFFLVKIIVLDMDEKPISSIEGRVQTGASINLDGSSAVRRTANISFIALEEENDLNDIDNLLSINKKIKLYTGIVNNFSDKYVDDVFWFPQGIFVIVNPSISHSSSGCIITLSCKDKMALLNGECGGNLPASITFHEYDQLIGIQEVEEMPTDPNNYTIYDFGKEIIIKGETSRYWQWSKEEGWEVCSEEDAENVDELDPVPHPNLVYDIIQTLVCNYGGESINKIIINDVPLEIKQLIRNGNTNSLYYNPSTSIYSKDQSLATDTSGNWIEFLYGEDCGYIYTDFVYPGELVSNIGENIVSVLEKIKNTLGNYEFFYDIDGNFVFQEIKNYLNTSYISLSMGRPTVPLSYLSSKFSNYLDGIEDLETNEERRNLIIQVVNNKGIFLGSEDNNYNITYPTIDNKTDRMLLSFINQDSAWEETKNSFIIDENNYLVDYASNKQSIYTFETEDGMITQFTKNPSYTNVKNDFHIWGKDKSSDNNSVIHYHLVVKSKPSIMNTYKVILKNNQLYIDNDNGVDYIPDDWRVELYLQGRTKESLQQRPDIYEQEILDLLPLIYEFKMEDNKIIGGYTEDITKVNDLQYFIDYLEPVDSLYDCSVDLIGPRIYSYQKDDIVRLYNKDVPDVIIINIDGDPTYNEKIIERCEAEGQPRSQVDGTVYSQFSVGTLGYSAQETARDLLYQYTDYNAGISFQCTPIYYLEPNTRITVHDRKANIYGDYIIKSISRPLNGQGTMSISATKALERI